MSQNISIALDAMGGDHGPSVVVPAALAYVAEDPSTSLILIGREDAILAQLPNGQIPKRVSLRPTTQEIGMDELPSRALRNKKDSSMRVAIDLVKSGAADACVSAGNTGALMATARFVLKTIPHVDRPAIITTLPAVNSRTWVLDLGANVDCTAEHLYQFAVMGAELVRAVEGIGNPTIGLLNVGQEEIKGNDQVKQAHDLIASSDLNYLGYIEGDDIYLRDDLDIVVCDGFIGNVALKTSEGVAKMIGQFMKAEFRKNLLTKVAGVMVLPVLKALRGRIDPRNYNGASLLGLRGVVVKSHGGADEVAFRNAIAIARKEVLADVANRIGRSVSEHLYTRESA